MMPSSVGYLLLLPRFEHLEPETVDEALELLSRYAGRARLIAGGTDLLVSMKKRETRPEYLINLKSIPGLDRIEYSQPDGLKIGSLVTLQSVADSPMVKDKFPMLVTACRKVGTPQVRNMGTIGGNICNAGPSQDTIPSLLALNARVKLVGRGCERVVPVQEFIIGSFQTAIRDTEILSEIQIPPLAGGGAGIYKYLTKVSHDDETLVGVAVLLARDESSGKCADVRIALGSVAPYAFRATQAEDYLRGKILDDSLIAQASKMAAEACQPRSRAQYRREMVALLVNQALHELWQNLISRSGRESR